MTASVYPSFLSPHIADIYHIYSIIRIPQGYRGDWVWA